MTSLSPLSLIQGDLADKFWSQVQKSENPDDCWIWTGYVCRFNNKPLPKFQFSGINGKGVFCKRVGITSRLLAWYLVKKDRPRHNLVNTCGNVLCVSPSHSMDTADTELRFWSKVDKTENCWVWTNGLDKDGYGKFWWDGKTDRAHRFSWELYNNSKCPQGMVVCHTCDNSSCVRPDHLFIGTPKDNTNDMVKKNRQLKGEQIGIAKLNAQKVIEIRQMARTGCYTQMDLAKAFGVAPNTIGSVLSRKTWKHVE